MRTLPLPGFEPSIKTYEEFNRRAYLALDRIGVKRMKRHEPLPMKRQHSLLKAIWRKRARINDEQLLEFAQHCLDQR